MRQVKRGGLWAAMMGAALLVSACETSVRPPSSLTETVTRQIPGECKTRAEATSTPGILKNAACSGVDLFKTYTASASSARTVTYAETDAFERALHASLKARHPTVTVTVNDESLTHERIITDTVFDDSPRLAVWIAALKGKGGEVLSCQARVPESMWLIGWVVDMLFSQMNDWLTYRPLNNYGAVALVFGYNNQLHVERAVFLRKDQPVACPAGTQPLADPAG